MALEDEINGFKMKADAELDIFFASKEEEGRKKNLPGEYFESLENIRGLVRRGGKRLRPLLFYCGYIFSGGHHRKEAMKASIALELLHAGFLIHDDIMDRDDIRRGGPSMHAKFRQDYSKRLRRDDLEDFGNAMAICAGDMVLAWSHEVLARSDFSGPLKMKAMVGLSDIITETALGQMMDEAMQVDSDYSEDRIAGMHDYKTARYSVRGPLRLGAIMAGADEEELEYIDSFSVPLGIAYQMRDDVLGLFGDAEKTGKPVGSDIIRGKKTLLVSYALRNSSFSDEEFLMSCLGNEELSAKDLRAARDIVDKSGALMHSEDKISEFACKAMENLRGGKKKFAAKYAPMEKFADFLLKRQG